MQYTAIIELFGSFFMSLAAKKQNKEELLKHLTNFKMILYSSNANTEEMTVVSKYLDELAENLHKQHMMYSPYKIDPIDKMHEDSRLFQEAFKERINRQKGKAIREEAKKKLTTVASAEALQSCKLKDRLKERQNMARSSSTMNLKL